MDTFENLQPGEVIYLRDASTAQLVRVLRVADAVIMCTPFGEPTEEAAAAGRVWSFDRGTGHELHTGNEVGPVWQRKGTWLSRYAGGLDSPERMISWRIIQIEEPLAEVDELYEHDRARFADVTAEQILGPTGRMIAASKTGYWQRHPNNLPVFNANVCTRERGKLWFGDLDLTLDEPRLLELAKALNEPVYVLYERAARFQTADTPAFDEAVAAIAPEGTVKLNRWNERAADGRLRPRRVRR
jgi:hypothetical protein